MPSGSTPCSIASVEAPQPDDPPAAGAAEPGTAAPAPPALSIEGASLGELLHHLPRSATDVDRMLLAGHFAQSRSADNAFSTGEANALLTEQGVKIGNPSQSVKQNVVARRVFRHQRRYRVSQIGLDYLRQTARHATCRADDGASRAR